MDAYPKGMFGFRLPPGYRVQVAPDVLVLRRSDGLMVAAFVGPVADPTEVEREARNDHRRPRNLPTPRPHQVAEVHPLA